MVGNSQIPSFFMLLTLIIASCMITPLPSSDLENIEAEYGGTWDTDGQDTCEDLEINKHGEAYTVGTSIPSPGNLDISLVKWNSEANVTWVRVMHGINSSYPRANARAVETFGDSVFVVGGCQNLLNDVRMLLAKWYSNGTLAWYVISEETREGTDLGIAIDGSIYVVGLANVTQPGLFLAKFNSSNGHREWMKRFSGYYTGYLPRLEISTDDHVITFTSSTVIRWKLNGE
ncbi:MAG: hypothetical protein JSW61_01240, partial [Candidatus Thorarchaeota archaeon]